jgi:hypothetical protein
MGKNESTANVRLRKEHQRKRNTMAAQAHPI